MTTAYSFACLLPARHLRKYGTGHGTRVNAAALFRAASVGDAAQVRLLLAAGADTEVKEENFGKTAVRIAEELAHAECVKILST